jgi:hypothetical protein
MNPYIERDAVWSDFHWEYIKAIKKALVPQVRPEFFVKIGEQIYIRTDEESRHLVGLGDVSVTKTSIQPEANGAVGLLEAPVRLRVPQAAYEEKVPFIEIFDKEYQSLVTVIELLSPSNKRKKKDREQFIGKREQILESSVNYVEIDLLRGGRRMPLADMPVCAYCVMVSPADDRPEVGFWPIGLRDPLPVIPIPVSETKTNVRIALQDLLHQVYDEAAYGDYIYNDRPEPRLRREDAAWAKLVLAATRANFAS